MKLIVGLGNPGKKYQNTRHNVGFMVIDAYLNYLKETTKLDTRFEAEICQTMVHQEKVILLKPMTYMNLSGQAILKTIQYFNIDLEDVLVFVDDINLNTGKLRLRLFGGHGGHNGLKHINQCLQSNRYKRVRIGIDHNGNIPLEQYVLKTFSKDEKKRIDQAVIDSVNIIDAFVQGKSFSDIMTIYNTQT